MDEQLSEKLVAFIRRKFAGYPDVYNWAQDIVQEAYVRVYNSKTYTPDKLNFGYLSQTCLRLCYRQFMNHQKQEVSLNLEVYESKLISESDFVEELLTQADKKVVLDSLLTLKEIEQIVVKQRYYGDFSFKQIALENGLNLNTVLSHHRRALNKLRPTLTRLLDLKDSGGQDDD